MYDLIIIGGGPAACAAGVYAARKQLKTLLIAKEFGGQSIVSPGIQNWIGTIEIPGDELAKSLKAHVVAYAGNFVNIQEGVTAEKVMGTESPFIVTASNGETYESRAVLVASGARRRKLATPGADIFEHRGLTYCATCDGPLFSGMDVAVIGGGNAGFESAAQLLAYVKSVTLLDIGEHFRAEPVTVEKVLAHPSMRGITHAKILEITGNKMVDGLVYENIKTGEQHTLPVQGVFVEIGTIPNTNMLEGVVNLNAHKHAEVDPRTQRTNVPGIWAAGDCTDGLYAQNNIAVGDAVKALEDIFVHLRA
ncbi:MAG: FAD-dependent oxidoreductase [Candidatus Pacebacteria bacterium]|nr:FAD-dependent oxidoreductase [Candidatus Paceibacterota bacterium]